MAKKITFALEVECENDMKESEIEKVLNLAINRVRRNTPSSDYITIGMFGEVKAGLLRWTEVVAHRD